MHKREAGLQSRWPAQEDSQFTLFSKLGAVDRPTLLSCLECSTHWHHGRLLNAACTRQAEIQSMQTCSRHGLCMLPNLKFLTHKACLSPHWGPAVIWGSPVMCILDVQQRTESAWKLPFAPFCLTMLGSWWVYVGDSRHLEKQVLLSRPSSLSILQ